MEEQLLLAERLSIFRCRIHPPTVPVRQSWAGVAAPTSSRFSGLDEALKSLSPLERFTLFMTLLATVQLLLSRYSSQRVIVVGSPVALRRLSPARAPLFWFLRLYVGVRTDLLATQSSDASGTGARSVSRRLRYQDVPFEKLVEALQPYREMSRSPLFQVSLDLERNDMDLPVSPA